MVVELLLVAVVLSFVGLAVFQSSRHSQTASVAQADKSAVGIAAAAAAAGQSEQTADAAAMTSTDASADQVGDTDVDISNLGGSTSANSY